MAIWSSFCVFPLLSEFLPQKTRGWRLFSALLLPDELQVVDSSHLTMAVAPPLQMCVKNAPVEKEKVEISLFGG